MSVWTVFKPVHQRQNGCGEYHYVSAKCGEFNRHLEPLSPILRAMLFFDCVTGCDKRSGT